MIVIVIMKCCKVVFVVGEMSAIISVLAIFTTFLDVWMGTMIAVILYAALLTESLPKIMQSDLVGDSEKQTDDLDGNRGDFLFGILTYQKFLA